METMRYDRAAAAAYAKKWAFGRNPAYYNFDKLGGDCTNYASQCLYAGCGIMDFTSVTGWFYKTANDRTASWTGVEHFYRFLTENQGAGPFGEEAPLDEVEIGDFVQLGSETGDFYHTPFVCGFSRGKILVAAHTADAYNRRLSSYSYQRVRGIHILGVRRD